MSKFPILVISDGTQASKMKPSILEFFQNGLNFTTKHCLKNAQIWSLFSPNAGKYGPENTPYLDTFHAVKFFSFIFSFIFLTFFILHKYRFMILFSGFFGKSVRVVVRLRLTFTFAIFVTAVICFRCTLCFQP